MVTKGTEPARVELLVKKQLLRDVPGWKNAPVPACFGGDPRSLTFCCHPGYSLTFGFKCQRDALLEKCGLSKNDFVKIKDAFSKKQGWDDPGVCFKSISYCCMRRGGCPAGRDDALRSRYPGKGWEDVLKEYFSRKKQLAVLLLDACKNRDVVEPFLEAEREIESIN
ncbi:MAG: hypothetical protein ACTSUE_10130 [Promethearchaeota archaeon]